MVDMERMVKFRCREVRGAVGGSVRVNLGPIVCAWMRSRVNRGASASQRREHRLSLLFDAICTIRNHEGEEELDVSQAEPGDVALFQLSSGLDGHAD